MSVIKPEKREISLTANQAVKVGQIHIKNFHLSHRWKNAQISNRFPIYSTKNKSEIAYYELKVSHPKKKDAGYIIVSVNGEDVPIPCFATVGKTFTERLKAKVGTRLLKVIMHSPSYMTAEDQKGRVIASIGAFPLFKIESEEGDIESSVKLYQQESAKKKKVNRKDFELDRSNKIDELWDHYLNGLSLQRDNTGTVLKSKGTEGEKIADDWFTIRYADGSWQQPTFGQVSPDDPINPHNHMSGCGPTAWAALFAYHDLHWDPCFLYGTHTYKTSYIKRLMILLHDVLKTEKGNHKNDSGYWIGSTEKKNMEDGYLIIDDYFKHEYDGSLIWWAYDCDYQDLFRTSYEVIYTHRHPLIVNYKKGDSRHYALGYGIAFTYVGSMLKAYICVNNLGGTCDPLISSECDQWVNFSYIRGVWSMHNETYSCPRKNTTEILTPSFAMDMTTLNDELYMVYPVDDNIHIHKTSAKNFPVPLRHILENPKSVSFNEQLILPSDRYHISAGNILNNLSNLQQPLLKIINSKPIGPISTCAWNYASSPRFGITIPSFEEQDVFTQIENAAARGMQKKADIDLIKKVPNSIVENSDKVNLEKEHTFKKKNLEMLGHIVYSGITNSFQENSAPYLFLCWRGPEELDGGKADDTMPQNWNPSGSLIHIAVLEIRTDLDFKEVIDENGVLKKGNLNFAHIVLPKRFKTVIDPAITIAENKDTGPMLYIAYSGDYLEIGLTSFTGHLLVLDLQQFFTMLISGEDQWPTERSDPTGDPGIIISTEVNIENEGTPSQTIEVTTHYDFNWFWVPFSTPVHNLNLDSDGTNVALIWTSIPKTLSSGWIPENALYAMESYFFTGAPTTGAYGFPDWGDKCLKVETDEPVSDFIQCINDFGNIFAEGRPDILSCENECIITWRDCYNLIYIAKKYGNEVKLRGDLLNETTHTAPAISYVKDNLNNQNLVLGWFGTENQMNHRLFFISPPINDYDNLPT